MREAFLDMFGLPSNASEADIKKRYRELVMKLHPDVNQSPHAVEQFRLIQKAYDYLTNEEKQMDRLYDQYNRSKAKKPKSRSEMTSAEKQDEMRERLRKYRKVAHKEARETEENVFKMLTSKAPWYVVRAFALCSVLFGFLLIVDFFMPVDSDMKLVHHKVFYQLFDKKTVFYKDKSQIDVNEKTFLALDKWDSLSLDYSPMFHVFEGYRIVKRSGEIKKIDGVFGLHSLFPFLPLMFLIPGILFFYQANEVKFYLLYFISLLVFPVLLLHYVLWEKRLDYLISYFSG